MDTLVLSATQNIMNSSSEGRGLGGASLSRQKCHHHHHYRQQQQLDYVQAIEEYVLDEHNLNTLQLFSMPLERRHQDLKSTQTQQQQPSPPPPPPPPHHHVRRSAELRTVSIIETLSELVSRTDNGHHLGGQHDCDGQCSGECVANSASGKQTWNNNSNTVNGSRGITHLCCSPTCKQFSLVGNELNEELNQRVFSSSEDAGNTTGVDDSCCQLVETTLQDPKSSDVAQRNSTNCCHCKECSSLVSVPPPPPPPPLPSLQLQQATVVAQTQLAPPVEDWSLENVVSAVSTARSRGGGDGVNSVDINRKGSPQPFGSSALAKQHWNTSAKTRREKGGRMTVSRLKKKTVNALLTSGGSSGGGGGHGAHQTRSGRNVNGAANVTARSTVCPSGHSPKSSTSVNYMGNQNCSSLRHQRDPNHFMLSTLKSKGRTPDWIAGIFSIARRGSLEKLMQALMDMDATLIRNLSDHRGNNLFHVCCCFGHLECLQWLMQRGKQCEDAILDENKYELTPLVCAVKYGKLPCVEWLITNSVARGQLVPSNGGRPLLHWAAKYGQEVILRWLAQFMENNDMGVNVKDGYGNTALHLAAKHGHAVSIKALVTHRCDVSLKNDLGYKASDYAILYGQTTCSEYLLSLEACLILSSDVASLDSDLNSTKTEMTEMKTQFKEVLSCAKKLVKEREELSQHLDQLQDGLVHLNNVLIAEIQSLCEENKLLRNSAAGTLGKMPNHPRNTLDETVALCHAMHTRWQEGQQRWFSPTALAEIQQKILLAEERWKRARARVTWGEKESKEHMNVFRERLTQVQCRTTGIRLSDIRSISSSESSLASMEEDTLSDYEDQCEMTTTMASSRTNPSGCPDCCCTCHEWKFFENHCYQQPPPPPPPPNLNFGVSNAKSYSSPSSQVVSSPRTKPTPSSGGKTSSSVARQLHESVNVLQQKRHANLNRTINVDLVSEGTCKVLEVIAAPATSNCKEKDSNLNGKQDSLIELINGGHQPWSIVNSSYVEFSGKEELPTPSSSKVKVGEVTSRKHVKNNNSGLGDCKSELIIPEKRDDGHSGDDEDDRNFNGLFDVRGRVCDQQQPHSSSEPNCRNVQSKGESKSGTSSSSSSGGCAEGNRCQEGHNTGDLTSGDAHASEKINVSNDVFNPSSAVGGNGGSGSGGGKLIFSEPDLIIGTKGARNNDDFSSMKVQENHGHSNHSNNSKTVEFKHSRVTATIETASGSSLGNSINENYASLVSPSNERAEDAVEDEEAIPLLSPLDIEKLNVSGGCEEIQQQPCCSNGSIAGGGPFARRKGFLQKLNLRWPSKRTKSIGKTSKKSQGQPQEITPEDFRETYMHLNRTNSGDESGAMEGGICEGTVPLLNQEMPVATNKVSRTNKESSKELTDKGSSSSSAGEGTPSSIVVKQKVKTFVSTEVEDTSLNLNKKHSSLNEPTAASVSSLPCLNNLMSSSAGKTEAVPPPPCCIPAGTTKRDVPIPPLPFNHRDLKLLSDNVLINNMRPSTSCPSDLQKATGDLSTTKNSTLNISNVRKEESNESQVDEDELPCNKTDDGDGTRSPVSDQQEESRVIENLPDDSHSVHAQANFPPQRPASLSTKSMDMSCPMSRPESSASRSEPTYLAFRHIPGFPLHKVASMSTDLLTSDSLTPSRMSPAPSEVSKTESALSPPSDISKTESMRHMRQLTRIEENITNRESRPLPALPIRRYDDVKRANIVDIAVEMQKQSVTQHKQQISLEGNGSQEYLEPNSKDKNVVEETQTATKDKTKSGTNSGKGVPKRSKVSKEEKPWYDLSDDEEIMMADVRLRNADMVKGHGSSEDEEAYFCT